MSGVPREFSRGRIVQAQAVKNLEANPRGQDRLVKGVSVVGFTAESIAEKTGMEKGDVIIEYDGVRDLTTEKLATLTVLARPKAIVRAVLVRTGQEQTLSLPSGPLGISAIEATIQESLGEFHSNAEIDATTLSERTAASRIGIGLIGLAYKIGPKIVSGLFKVGKSLKVGKVGLAATSMAAYSSMFTWQFAAMIMIALFIHESGHIWAMKRLGLRTKGIYFIPFLGAAAVADAEFPSRRAESFIAIMGPIWGLALAVLTGTLYLLVQDPVFAAAAGWMAAINLLNLLPISPLDGGSVFKSIAYSTRSVLGFGFLILGLVASGVLAFLFDMGLFVFLLFVGTIELLFEYKRRVQIPGMTGIQIAYAVLAFVCVTGLFWALMGYMNHVPGADLAMKFLQFSPVDAK